MKTMGGENLSHLSFFSLLRQQTEVTKVNTGAKLNQKSRL